MTRAFHKYVGLTATILLLVLAISGVALSVIPTLEKVKSPALVEQRLNVAELATRIAHNYPGAEQIRRAPSGRITVYYFENDTPGAQVIDPATGRGIGEYESSAVVRWLKNLHRSLLLGDAGRITAAIGAVSLLIMSISGTMLIARRMGGWRKFFGRSRGALAGRIHVEIGRFSVVGLILATITSLYMTLGTFDLLPKENNAPAFPAQVSETTGAFLADMQILRETPVLQLRSLTFPYADDPTDVYSLSTNTGEGYIDQGTGEVLSWQDAGPWQKVNEFIYLLHTGEGAASWGLLMGLMVLGLPVLVTTGIVIWLAARRARPKLPKGVPASQADTVILVGSEGGTTWGFAGTLQSALMENGHSVHTAALSRFSPEKYTRAKNIIVLAATYGEGVAPASAKGFLDKLIAMETPPKAGLSILGFGDRQFPEYCAFAQQVAKQAADKGWQQITELDTVDRQSPQDFARWGISLGNALGHPLELAHEPVQPRTKRLELVSRRDYGQDVQAPTAILRFALPQKGFWARLRGKAWSNFDAGDLLGIIPEGANVARLYSLASGTNDGFVEICVRKHLHGLCSGQLFDLEIGDSVDAFIRANPAFRPSKNRKPVILIGAGTGVGPLAGFARANAKNRPMHLYFGIRHPESDYLYNEELQGWKTKGKLSSVTTASSRLGKKEYVQDILRKDGLRIAVMIEEGAQVLVCGGREMAAGVGAVLHEILAPHGMEISSLKAKGRYLEDVY